MKNQNLSGHRASNRRNLFIGFIPVLLALALCLVSVTQRLVSDARSPGQMSSREAGHLANTVCKEIIGGDVSVAEARLYQAFPNQQSKPIRQWDVICDTPQGQYLVRINADTQQVFGINRLAFEYGTSAQEAGLSRAEAEVYSRRYLPLLGIHPEEVQPVLPPGTGETLCWNFRYRSAPVQGQRNGLMMITVEAATGNLVAAWSLSNIP